MAEYKFTVIHREMLSFLSWDKKNSLFWAFLVTEVTYMSHFNVLVMVDSTTSFPGGGGLVDEVSSQSSFPLFYVAIQIPAYVITIEYIQ